MILPVAEQARNAVVLMVEDNHDHAFLAQASFDEARLMVDLHHVDSGDKCLAFLRREAPYEDAPWPDLLLLDIHMPRMNGYEVMEAIVADDKLKSLPVIVLSTSSEPVDVNRMYALRCNAYITKPVEFANFTAAVQKMAGYWFKLVVLPEAPLMTATDGTDTGH